MTCAKKRVRCLIVQGSQVFEGYNDCDNPQEECPREKGEDYTKCKTICKQPGHAEEMAILAAEEAGVSLEGAICFLGGIDHYCKECQRKLNEAGVKSLRFTK